ncbi:WSC-domain-containing protein, partial [Hyaloscypha hepaticicola]
YTIFGVEAADNCYCGKALANEPASASSDDCIDACTLNPQEICGACWRINIYSLAPTTASPTGYSNLACWSDTTLRILPGSSTAGTDMDIIFCQDFCSQNSYTIFGVGATANCYCGNTLANKPASASPNDCSITCAGNPQEICGANWRIN